MKKFLKDYVRLCKETGRFYKKHWLGVIVMNLVSSAAMLAWFNRENIKEALNDKFHKDEA